MTMRICSPEITKMENITSTLKFDNSSCHRPRRRIWWNRSLLFFLITSVSVQSVTATGTTTTTTTVLTSQEKFENCKEYLSSSDLNGDSIISSTEYIAFANNLIPEEESDRKFTGIPSPLLLTYVHLSCLCNRPEEQKVKGKYGCCEGGKSVIRVNFDSADEEEEDLGDNIYYKEICDVTEEAIYDALSLVRPTEIPSLSPTFLPSESPSTTPSTVPTAWPTSPPTSPPTSLPTISPSSPISTLSPSEGLEMFTGTITAKFRYSIGTNDESDEVVNATKLIIATSRLVGEVVDELFGGKGGGEVTNIFRFSSGRRRNLRWEKGTGRMLKVFYETSMQPIIDRVLAVECPVDNGMLNANSTCANILSSVLLHIQNEPINKLEEIQRSFESAIRNKIIGGRLFILLMELGSTIAYAAEDLPMAGAIDPESTKANPGPGPSTIPASARRSNPDLEGGEEGEKTGPENFVVIGSGLAGALLAIGLFLGGSKLYFKNHPISSSMSIADNRSRCGTDHGDDDVLVFQDAGGFGYDAAGGKNDDRPKPAVHKARVRPSDESLRNDDLNFSKEAFRSQRWERVSSDSMSSAGSSGWSSSGEDVTTSTDDLDALDLDGLGLGTPPAPMSAMKDTAPTSQSKNDVTANTDDESRTSSDIENEEKREEDEVLTPFTSEHEQQHNSTSLDSARSSLNEAIEAGDWSAVSAAAALLSTSNGYGPSTRSIFGNSTSTPTDFSQAEITGHLHELVDAGDWGGVIQTAEMIEGDEASDSESKASSPSSSSSSSSYYSSRGA